MRSGFKTVLDEFIYNSFLKQLIASMNIISWTLSSFIFKVYICREKTSIAPHPGAKNQISLKFTAIIIYI